MSSVQVPSSSTVVVSVTSPTVTVIVAPGSPVPETGTVTVPSAPTGTWSPSEGSVMTTSSITSSCARTDDEARSRFTTEAPGKSPRLRALTVKPSPFSRWLGCAGSFNVG